jgi:hypothetical protein
MNTEYTTDLIDTLNSNVEVAVTFKTKAGTSRTMQCTRMVSMIPESGSGYTGIGDTKLDNAASIAVYDYQNSAWRAFRKDSVISYVVIT